MFRGEHLASFDLRGQRGRVLALRERLLLGRVAARVVAEVEVRALGQPPALDGTWIPALYSALSNKTALAAMPPLDVGAGGGAPARCEAGGFDNIAKSYHPCSPACRVKGTLARSSPLRYTSEGERSRDV